MESRALAARAREVIAWKNPRALEARAMWKHESEHVRAARTARARARCQVKSDTDINNRQSITA